MTTSKTIVAVVLAASVYVFGQQAPSTNNSKHASQERALLNSTADHLSFDTSIRHDKTLADAHTLFAVLSQDDPDGCCIQSFPGQGKSCSPNMKQQQCKDDAASVGATAAWHPGACKPENDCPVQAPAPTPTPTPGPRH